MILKKSKAVYFLNFLGYNQQKGKNIMSNKVHRPKVKIPSQTKVMAMLSPRRDGITDRSYIKSMAVAIDSYERHKNNNMKKITRETTSEE